MTDSKLPFYSNFCCCRGCGEYFTTARNFDYHRRGEREKIHCVHPSKLVGRYKLTLNARGYWQRPGSDPTYQRENIQ